MKKIIALAVASAFVAPAMAAEISVNGSIEYVYISGDNRKDTTSNKDVFMNNDNAVEVSATEEVNGITVTGTIAIVDDVDNGAFGFEQDGSSLSLAGAFGELEVGDVSGAIDSVGDYTDVAPFFGGFAGDGDDAVIAYNLPVIAGLAVTATYSPEGGYAFAKGQSTSKDSSGIAATYTMGPVAVYYGAEEIAKKNSAAYGLKASSNGFTFAAEFAEEDGSGADSGDMQGDKTKNFGVYTKNGADIELASYALTYKVGDITVGGEMHTIEEDGNADKISDMTVVFAEYGLGSNVDIYVSYMDEAGSGFYENDKNGDPIGNDGEFPAKQVTTLAKGQSTAIGIEYNF